MFNEQHQLRSADLTGKLYSYLPALRKVSEHSMSLHLCDTYANAHQEAHHVRLLLLLKLLDILEGTHLDWSCCVLVGTAVGCVEFKVL